MPITVTVTVTVIVTDIPMRRFLSYLLKSMINVRVNTVGTRHVPTSMHIVHICLMYKYAIGARKSKRCIVIELELNGEREMHVSKHYLTTLLLLYLSILLIIRQV